MDDVFKTDVAKFVFKNKYSHNGEKWADTVLRVVNHVAQNEKDYKKWASKFYQIIYNRYFIPGGRILANAGTQISNLMNCFYMGVEDSRQGIYDTLKNAAEIFAHGGGIGYNFSHLREKGAYIKGTGGKASGPVSFMRLFDETGEVIEQASRRGAQMGILNVDHPDIVEFINMKSTLSDKSQKFVNGVNNLYKQREGKDLDESIRRTIAEVLRDSQMTHFNISVGLTNRFMEAVENDEEWELISPLDGKVKKKVKARGLFKLIAQRAWESGDPGVIFLDRVNEDNIVPYYGYLEGSNPCLRKGTVLYDGEGKEIKIGGTENAKFTGEYVITRQGYSPIFETNTLRMWRTGVKDIVKLTLDNGHEIELTPDHRILVVVPTVNGYYKAIWTEAKDAENFYILPAKSTEEVTYFMEGEFYLSQFTDIFGNLPKVVSVEKIGKAEVWDFKVKEDLGRNWTLAQGFVVHNCGEIFLFDKEACNLGAINLLKIYDKEERKINWRLYEEIIRTAIRFLDDVIDITSTPIQEINDTILSLRRIGLGVMGLADLLAEMEIPYNSEEAYNLAEQLSHFLTMIAIDESYKLGEEKGAFPLYDPKRIDYTFIKKVMGENYLVERPLRNVSWTALQPTGSISLLAEVNSAIEPFFALAYKKNISFGEDETVKTVIIMNDLLEEKLKEYNLTEKQIQEVREYVLENGTLKNAPHVPVQLQAAFITAKELTPEEHIKMQSAWQKWISNAVSKTINMPNFATPEDVEKAFKLMWREGVKGGTIYRDGSKTFQVLN